jgi:3-phosphoinositide dependent protein kinase-1
MTFAVFAMTFAKRGEMLDLLRKLGSFDDEVTQFYTAEIVSALDYLHRLGVVHRDLKPENVLLGENMHILISDFGSSKIMGQQDGRKWPYFCCFDQLIDCCY